MYNYIVSKQYPDNLSKDDKRRLREKYSSFDVRDGVLMCVERQLVIPFPKLSVIKSCKTAPTRVLRL